mgnify:CR=1 FL=1
MSSCFHSFGWLSKSQFFWDFDANHFFKMKPIEYWQIDKIESMLILCPYDEHYKQEILNNLPETKEEADKLLSTLWDDHIPRDPKDQFDKMMKMNTLVKLDWKFSYLCKDCRDDFISRSKETLCTQCLSPNIKETTDETKRS